MMRISSGMVFPGKCLSADIKSSPGALRFGRCLIICWIVPGYVKYTLARVESLIPLRLTTIVAMAGPWLRQNGL